MMAPINVGLVGAGDFAEAHLRALARSPQIRVRSIADPQLDRAERLATIHGVPQTFANHDQLLEDEGLDAVAVVCAEEAHVLVAVAALDAGRDVLVEKPIAPTAAEAARLQDAAARSDCVLLPGHILRFAAPYQALRRAVDDGHVGRILAITARRDRSRLIADHYHHVHPALLTSIHDIDQLLWILRETPVRVRALASRVDHATQPHLLFAQLEFPSGAVATVSTAYVDPPDSVPANSDRLEIYGQHGRAWVDLSSPPVRIEGRLRAAPDTILTPEAAAGALEAEWAHFAALVRRDVTDPVVNIEEAVAGIRVAEALVRSEREGGAIVPIER
jgi:predicted dehydrogenase